VFCCTNTSLHSESGCPTLAAIVARSDVVCGCGGCPSFSSASGRVTANIPEDIIANEVDTTRLVYPGTNKRSNIRERQAVGRATVRIQRQEFAATRIWIESQESSAHPLTALLVPTAHPSLLSRSVRILCCRMQTLIYAPEWLGQSGWSKVAGPKVAGRPALMWPVTKWQVPRSNYPQPGEHKFALHWTDIVYCYDNWAATVELGLCQSKFASNHCGCTALYCWLVSLELWLMLGDTASAATAPMPGVCPADSHTAVFTQHCSCDDN